MTVPGQGRDIFLARFNQDLVIQDSVTVNGLANGDDEGYVMAFDEAGFLYLVGYLTESGQGHNCWLGKFDADLDLVDSTTVNGSENEDDDAYGILFDPVSGHLYVAGHLRETGEGANIWLAIYDTDLDPVKSITLNGPVGNDTDKARFMTFDDTRHLFVSGSMSQAGTDYDIWLAKFEADLDFVDQVVVAGPTTEEDKGYGIVFDGDDTLFVTGTMIETDESYNIWMAKYDTDLTPGFGDHQWTRRRRGRRLPDGDRRGRPHLPYGHLHRIDGRIQYLARPLRFNAHAGILDDGKRSGKWLGHRHRRCSR